MTMTRDELQTKTLSDCDQVLGLSRWLVSTDQRNRATAQRSYWQTARPPELDRLLSLMPHGEAVGAGPIDDVTDLLAWLRGTGSWQSAFRALADLIYWVSQQIPDGVAIPPSVFAPAVSGSCDLTAFLILSVQALRSGSTAETMQVHDLEVIALN